MNMDSFYTEAELRQLGLRSFGDHVTISRKASLYSPEKISVGSHVRIDDFCILSGLIELGSYIHISAYTALHAGNTGIVLRDFATVSARCALYAENDDYSGESMTNPTVPESCRKVQKGRIILHRHVIIGSGSTLLPGVVLNEGCAVGAMSLVKSPLEAWTRYAGIPCRKIGERSRRLLEFEKKLFPLCIFLNLLR